MTDFKQIDPLLHSRIRLAIMSVLLTVEEADFNYLKESTGATDGNLSTHIYKLEEADYLKIIKRFVDNKPKTMCRMTETGRDAFGNYVKVLENMLHLGKED
ncbi:MAG: transcriptional regulator [Candidatus Marinimicrobia bacterium]|nr:transcriptional regulator [Candidatus Neomarinimicrobiota bacterium]